MNTWNITYKRHGGTGGRAFTLSHRRRKSCPVRLILGVFSKCFPSDPSIFLKHPRSTYRICRKYCDCMGIIGHAQRHGSTVGGKYDVRHRILPGICRACVIRLYFDFLAQADDEGLTSLSRYMSAVRGRGSTNWSKNAGVGRGRGTGACRENRARH